MTNFNNTKRTTKLREDTELFYKKFFIDKRVNASNNYAKHFIKDDLTYGNGIKAVFVGTVETTDYDETQSPFVDNRIEPELTVATLKDGVETKRVITIKDFDYEAFNSAEEKQAFDDIQLNTLTAQAILRDNKAIIKAFGGTVNDKVFSPKEKTLWENIATEISNIKEETITGNEVDFLQGIRNVSYDLTQESETNSMNSGDNIIHSPLQDQILILSQRDYEKLLKVPATTKNPDFKLPDITTLILPIPEKTAYIIDKNALGIYPRFKALKSQSYIDPLITKSVLHEWYKAGIIKNYAGRKIKLNG